MACRNNKDVHKVSLELELDNAAFERNPEREVARILEELAEKVRGGRLCDDIKLRDVNGNTVGEYKSYCSF